MGAYGLAAVAAFAVALAVLMSAPTAQADVYDDKTGTTAPTEVQNGDTVYIDDSRAAATNYIRFEISTIKGAKASFTHSDATEDGQSIICNDNDGAGSCDVGGDAGGTRVALKIADDSDAGAVFVTRTQISDDSTQVDTINVTLAQVPGSLTVISSLKTLDHDDRTDVAVLTITLKDTTSDKKGIVGESVTLVTTNGVFVAATDADGTAADVAVPGDNTACVTGDAAVQACSAMTLGDAGNNADTNGDGVVLVRFRGADREGVADITVTHSSGLTDSIRIVLSGDAKNLSASAEQGSIERGGSVFVVLTVTDSEGNPIREHTGIAAPKIKGPNDDATPVGQSINVDKDSNENRKVDKGDIPACGNHANSLNPTETPSTNLTSNGEDDGDDVEAGTNADGQCVVQVTTSSASASATTRGTHTLTFKLSSASNAATATVEIAVSGAPHSISSDAPARIDPSSELTVNITVVDDEDVRVGAVDIEVIQTAGDGAIIVDAADETSDGRAKFTYLAPSTPGVVEFLVRTRTAPANEAGSKVTAHQAIILDVAEEAMEDEPEMPAMPESEPTLTVTHSLGIFSGGSVTELIDAANAACPGGARIWLQDAGGAWRVYSSSAPAFVNATFIAAFPGDLGQRAVFVSECAGDAMSDEG